MPDEQPGVAVDRREAQHLQAQLLGAALGVVQLGDRCAVRAEHAQRRVHGVTVLGVLDGDQGAVVREVADARRLAVPVDLGRVLALAGQVDRRALLVRGTADDRRAAVAGQGETGRIGGFEAGDGGLVRPSPEGLAAPDAELVTVLVVEPPDPGAVRGEHAVRRAVRPERRLPLLARRTVPGVQLVRARRVRHEQGAVRRVLRPVGQRHARCPKPLLPVRHAGRVTRARLVALTHGPSHAPIVPGRADNWVAGVRRLWITSRP